MSIQDVCEIKKIGATRGWPVRVDLRLLVNQFANEL